jgi:hypothetical protein
MSDCKELPGFLFLPEQLGRPVAQGMAMEAMQAILQDLPALSAPM